MKTISIEDVTTKAVNSALDVLDEATDGLGKRSQGPLGDKLAFGLHEMIEKALNDFMNDPNNGPAFIRAV